MKLQDVMIRNVVQIAPTEATATAAKKMFDGLVGCLVITVNDSVKGIVTDRDLLGCLAQGHDPQRCQVAAHMHRPVFVLRPEEEIATAAEVMGNRRIKRLPVAKMGKLLGIVSLSDLAKAAGEDAKALGSTLRFFNAVLHAQSAQWQAPQQPAQPVRTAPAALMPAEDGGRDDLVDVGGPG